MFSKSIFRLVSIPLTLLLLLDCGASLKGKPTPAIPELAGFYINSKSQDWLKDEKLKIQALWIRRTARGEMEFFNKTLTRLQFSVSENREELKVRSGKIQTSNRELLFVENLYKEYHRMYSGKNTSDAKNWDLRAFSPFGKVKEVASFIGEGSSRSGELSEDNRTIVFSNGEKYVKVGGPLIGRISTTVGKLKKAIDNEVAGVLFFPLSSEAFPQEAGKFPYLAFFSTTDGMSSGTVLRIGDYPGQAKEVFDHVAVVDVIPKAGTQVAPLESLTPVILDGTVDLKSVSQKETTEELIRRLKQDPNLSKEELIRELEKLKGSER
ncbi:LIC12353 family lipoprotein [Leptospira wolffii]|uniref:LIC12353 family lipoprotein n=1 Tax=Leptospira wolffii TaxID=409998 RepID=UPI0003110A88|nr:hypothetical protein [Leptospira wolffii]EPG68204.1 hypothetical protein LEP1GSC061_0831 [Leptospira wolffii serovar Khorat str. Khorat-H2]